MSLKVVTNLDAEIEVLAKQVVDCAFQVHTTMRAGLLESVYEECFAFELQDRGLHFEKQKRIPLVYKNHKLKLEHRIDLIIEDKIIIELKAVERLLPIHKAQLLSYMHLTDVQLGFLMNFNVPLIKDGIQRLVL